MGEKFESFINSVEVSIQQKLPLWVIVFLGCYTLFSLLLAIYFYRKLRNYFSLKDLKEQGSKMNEEDLESLQELEDSYPEFKRNDAKNLSFIRCFLGALILFWPRIIYMILSMGLVIFLWAVTSCCATSNKPNRKTSKCRWWTSYLIMLIFGTPSYVIFGFVSCFKQKRDNKVNEVYKKYLGIDYDINKPRQYSCIISNHLGWIECFIYAWKLFCGFVAKAELGKMPLLSNVLFNLNCLLLDRASKDDRELIARQLIQRQESFINGENASPLLVYPEGSYTNGKYLLGFKKGVFTALLPIKPMLIEIDEWNSNVPETPIDILEHCFYTFSFLWQYLVFWELPVVEYTEHMKGLCMEGESDADCYARVVQMIYCEIGGLKSSVKGTRDLLEFEKLARARRHNV